MPEDFIHIQQQDSGTSENLLKKLRELFPAGQGFVEIKPNGEFALSIPGGGASGSGETYYYEVVTVATLNQLPTAALNPKYSSQNFTIFTEWGASFPVETGAFTVNPATRALSLLSSEFPFQPGLKLLYIYAIDPNTGVPMLPFPSLLDNRFCTADTGTLPNGVSYTVRASNSAGAGQPWQAFDTDSPFSGNFWFAGVFSPGDAQWLELELSQNITVGSVDITPVTFLAPKNFRFQVGSVHSPSGAGYTEVFTRTNETWANTGAETKNFVIPNPQAGKIFRIEISETNSNGNSPGIYTLVLKP